ncbi:MAG: DMT family transporter [Lachnospiraceae bacterium]
MKKQIIILGVLGVSFSAILVRFSDADSLVLAFYRMIFSALLLFPSLLLNHKKHWKGIGRKQLLLCMLSGLFLGIHFTCYFESLRWTSIAASVVLVNTEIFFVTLGEIFLLKEHPGKSCIISMCITFAGSVVIAVGDLEGGYLLGDILALCSAGASSIYTLCGRKVRSSMSTTAYTGIVYFTAGMVTLCGSFISKQSVLNVHFEDFMVAFLMTVFCTLLGHSIFSWGLKYESASFISTVKLLEPVFATLFGMLIFQEIPSAYSISGGLIIIAGIIMCIYSTTKKGDR